MPDSEIALINWENSQKSAKMETGYENKIESLLINKTSAQGGTLVIAKFDETENLRGGLAILVEIQSSDKDNAEIVKILTADLHKNFKESPTASLELAFEDTLSKINIRLKDILLAKPKNWLNKMHVLVIANEGREVHLSAVGEIHAFLVNREKMVDVLGSTLNKSINPLKLFSSVTSGGIGGSQSLVIINEAVLDYISPERIRKTANDWLPAQATARLSQLLERAPANKKFGAIFVKRVKRANQILVNPDLGQRGEPKQVFSAPLTKYTDPRQAAKSKRDIMLAGVSELYSAPAGEALLPPSRLALKTRFAREANKIFTFALKLISEILERCLKTLEFVREKSPDLLKTLKSMARNQEARKYYFRKIKDFFQNFILNILNKLSFIWNKYSSLPKRERIIVAAVTVLSIILIISLAHKTNTRSTRLAEMKIASLTNEIEQKLSQGEASIIYNDAARANALLNDARALLADFPHEKEEQKTKSNELAEKINGLFYKLENIKLVEKYGLFAEIAGLTQPSNGDLTRLGDKLVYFNAGDKKIFALDQASGEITAISSPQAEDFSEAVATDEENLALLSADKVTIINPVGQIKEQEAFNYQQAESGQYQGFAGNIYFLNPRTGAISRYRKAARGFSGAQSWLRQTEDLNSALSLAIDGKIYVLTKANEIQIFSSGVKQSTIALAINEPIKDNATIYTGAAHNDLFVFDPSNKRIIVVGKGGKLGGQYKIKTDQEITAFSLSANSKNAYFLSGNQIYQFELN